MSKQEMELLQIMLFQRHFKSGQAEKTVESGSKQKQNKIKTKRNTLTQTLIKRFKRFKALQ
jgi:hypothetical protein